MEFARLDMPRRVCLGRGLAANLPELLGKAKKIVLFTDRTIRATGLLSPMLSNLEKAGIHTAVVDGLVAEPTVYQAESAVRSFRALGADAIVAVGGGSVMDVAKLASVLDTEEYSIFDLLERPEIAKKQTPTLMVPTTAGTGAEATPNAIVTVPEKALKVGIVNPAMIADTVVLDAEMIRRLPRRIAAATGIDAMAHAIECYTSKKATPFSNLCAKEAFRLIEANIEAACDDRFCDMAARESMLLAAFLAGAAITASGTTGVHALSYPLGGKYHIPHGIANAILLMPVMRFNETACREELAEIYRAIRPEGNERDERSRAAYVLSRMEAIINNVGITPSLKPYGVGPDQLDALVEAGMRVSRLLRNNKRPILADDARVIYVQVL